MYFLCRPIIIYHLSMEHTTKIKPNPPDHMRKEKREKKNKIKKEGRNEEEGRRRRKKGWMVAMNWAVWVSWTTVGSSLWVTHTADPRQCG